MKRRPNMTKSKSGDAFVPMVSVVFADGYDKRSADDSRGEREGCLTCGGVPVCYGRIVLCFP